jgi:membrane protease subunit HflK
LAEYIKAPEVTRRRIYIETLQDVMPSVRSKIIVDERMRSILPFLNLDSQKVDSQKGDSQKGDSQKADPQKTDSQKGDRP